MAKERQPDNQPRCIKCGNLPFVRNIDASSQARAIHPATGARLPWAIALRCAGFRLPWCLGPRSLASDQSDPLDRRLLVCFLDHWDRI